MKILLFLKLLFAKSSNERTALDFIMTQIRVECYWMHKLRSIGLCRSYISKKARHEFGIEYGDAQNSMIGYIEHLESKLKDNNIQI